MAIISAAMRWAISCSPRAPGTSDGLTESMATRSRSREITGSLGMVRAAEQGSGLGTRAGDGRSLHYDLPMNGTTPEEIARAIALAAQSAGGHALVVGGWVRDRLLG